jgi:uncharacterized membrane protein YphA (DoxX/SURF4 family)
MARILKADCLYRVVRLGLALLFVYGGAVKLIDPKAFARIISAYRLVPEPLLPFVAVGLPTLETLAGLALLFDIRGGLAMISSLLGLFILVLGYGILWDLDVDCGCFGAADLAKRDRLRQAFARDLVLVAIVVPFLYLSRRLRGQFGKSTKYLQITSNERRT